MSLASRVDQKGDSDFVNHYCILYTLSLMLSYILPFLLYAPFAQANTALTKNEIEFEVES